MINEAYSVLRDERSRAAYDLSLRRPNWIAAERRFVARRHTVPHEPLRRFTGLWLTVCATAAAVAVCYSTSDHAPVGFVGRAGTFWPLNSRARAGAASELNERAIGLRIASPEISERERAPSLGPRDIELANSTGYGEAFYEGDWRGSEGRGLGDRFIDESTCSSAEAKGSRAFQACLSRDLSETLPGAVYMSTNATDDSEIIAAQLACEPLRLENPGMYEGCVDVQLNRRIELHIGAAPGRRRTHFKGGYSAIPQANAATR